MTLYALILLIRVSLASVSESPLYKVFKEYIKEYNKQYTGPVEEGYRYRVFSANIGEINREQRRGVSYEIGINNFTDWTWREFESRYLGVSGDAGRSLQQDIKWEFSDDFSSSFFKSIPKNLLTPQRPDPSTFLRRVSHRNSTTSVKDQKSCSACYAFAAITCLESLFNLTEGDSLSAQQLLDCSPSDDGCKGGSPLSSLRYIRSSGLSAARDYPYKAQRSACQAPPTPPKIAKNSFRISSVPASILSILRALHSGPVAVTHVATARLKAYKGGVFADSDCSAPINHSTALVGFDLDSPVPFLEAKNAWGSNWGEQGFYRIPIGELSDRNRGFCRMMEGDAIVGVTL